MFKPEEIYYEKSIKSYDLGIQLLKKYENVPKKVIENHNNIEELRNKSNKDFPILKKKLIIGVRKTHKYSPNQKVSDFLVPYTSSRLHSVLFVLLFSLSF
jgi:spore photoproduct lyase